MKKQTADFTEQQKLTDLLSGQKYVTGVYNTFYCEAASTQIKNCLSSILEDEHKIQEEIFSTMQQKGYYPVQKATESKISAAKQKFGESAKQ